LIRRVEGVSAHAIGTPLITNSDGTKFGKSEGNAVWLDETLTSPYAFYQFWLNTDDADVIARLKIFTFLSRAEIERLEQAVADEPFRREAQRTLAFEVTQLVHGADATKAAIDASAALFGNGDLEQLDVRTLESALRELPTASAAPSATVAQLLVDTALTASLSEARRAIAQGGVYVNNRKVDSDQSPISDHLIAGRLAVLRRGKKTLAGVFLAE
jgi:tyrosyl-tRNA synthetase